MKYRVVYDLVVEASDGDEAVIEARALLDDPNTEPTYIAIVD